jgi:multiple sugar transport system permease protein
MISKHTSQLQDVKLDMSVLGSNIRWTRWWRNGRFYLFASPWWLLGFLGLTLFPLGYALWLSFTNFDGYTDPRWVGLRNYIEAFHDASVWLGFQRTFLYMAFVVPLGIVGALILAVMLNRRMRMIGLMRTLYYLPSVVPIVGVAMTFQMLFSRDTGAVNAFLGMFHLPAVDWLTGGQAFVVLILMSLWGLGGGMIVTLAGLQTVPVELLEAATIDGANAWRRFWSVTLPLLSPVLFFQLVTGIIAALQVMIQPMLLVPGLVTSGGGSNASSFLPQSNQVYMYHVYTEVFVQGRFGYGSALIWILFIAILLLTLLIFFGLKRWVYYEVGEKGEK